jgi:hypothetical protein
MVEIMVISASPWCRVVATDSYLSRLIRRRTHLWIGEPPDCFVGT